MPLPAKWRNLCFVALAELLAMALWFSASAVVPQLTTAWHLDGSQEAWLTMSVQLGFVMGTVLSGVLNLADRMDSRRLFVASAVLGAIFNASIPLLNCGPGTTIVLRFLTGVSLAGVYPPGMKIMATWCHEDRGLGIGILVAAVTMGSAMPYLLNAVPLFGTAGMPPWPSVLFATSGMAVTAAIIAGFFVQTGPFLDQLAPFDWRFALRGFVYRPTRLANFGYLGHMWELYAMWVWCPLFLIASYEAAGRSLEAARWAGFAVIAVGAVGSVLAGILADRVGRTTVTAWSLAVSGICSLVVGFFFAAPVVVTVLCLVWGFAVVADSAQFSAAMSELTEPRYVGTALTVQTGFGFLLTLVTIQIIPLLTDAIGWNYVFVVLAIGPAFGIWSMLELRRLPEARRMASGNR